MNSPKIEEKAPLAFVRGMGLFLNSSTATKPSMPADRVWTHFKFLFIKTCSFRRGPPQLIPNWRTRISNDVFYSWLSELYSSMDFMNVRVEIYFVVVSLIFYRRS